MRAGRESKIRHPGSGVRITNYILFMLGYRLESSSCKLET